MNLYYTLLFNTLQSERMLFLSSDMMPHMPLWIVWKLKFKAGEFPHPPHHTKNHPTEFHWHDTCLPPFHHSSLCQSKLHIQVAVPRRLPCLTPDTTLKLFFMSLIDCSRELLCCAGNSRKAFLLENLFNLLDNKFFTAIHEDVFLPSDRVLKLELFPE